jgi:hypothetical protein
MNNLRLLATLALILASSAQAASPDATCWSASVAFKETELGLSEKICIETAEVVISEKSATLYLDRGKSTAREMRATILEFSQSEFSMSAVLERKEIDNGEVWSAGSVELFFDTNLNGGSVRVTRLIGETESFTDKWHRQGRRQQTLPFNAIAPNARGANDLDCTGAQTGTFTFAKRLSGSWLIFKSELRSDDYVAKPFSGLLGRNGSLDVTNRFEGLGSDDYSLDLRFDGARVELIRNRDSRPPRWLINETVSCR